jgi:hypothetical protein
MCYIDGQKNKFSMLNECNRMLKYNITNKRLYERGEIMRGKEETEESTKEISVKSNQHRSKKCRKGNILKEEWGNRRNSKKRRR